MNLRITLPILSLLLAGCHSPDSVKNEFEMKVHCAGLADSQNRDVNSVGGYVEVFYSPKLNTCIAGTTLGGTGHFLFLIRDILTETSIDFEGGSPAISQDDLKKKWEQKIADLKKSN